MRFYSIVQACVLCALFAYQAMCAPNDDSAVAARSIAVSSMHQVVSYSRENPGVNFSVDLTATVNYWDREWYSLYIQEGKHATFVEMPEEYQSDDFSLSSGNYVRVIGTYLSREGVVSAERIYVVQQDGGPIAADEVAMDDLSLGQKWSCRIRTRGVVESALISNDRSQFIVRDGDTRFVCRLKRRLTQSQVGQVVGAEVAMVGTLSYLIDSVGRPLTRMCLSMPSDEFTITKPGDVDYSNPTEIESISDSELMALPSEPFQMSGQIGYKRFQDFWTLEVDDDAAVSVYAPFESDIHVSDIVRVVAVKKDSDEILDAMPTLGGQSDSVGREADVVAKLVVWEKMSSLPPAKRFQAEEVVQRRCHLCRASVSGELVSISSEGSNRRLLLQDNEVYFEGRFSADEALFRSLNLARARSVSVSGLVEHLDGTLGGVPRFSISMGVPQDDIIVVSEWPQIDRRYALGIVLGMACLLVSGLLLLVRLRNRFGDQRKDLEDVLARLNSSYDAVHEALLVVDHKKGVVGANSKVLSVLGLTSKSLSVGSLKSVGERIASCFCERKEFLSAWNEIQTDPYVTQDFEFDTVGTPRRSLCVYTAPVMNRKGEADGRIWSFDDVSHRKQLESDLMQAQKMEAVGRLAGGIAHDFNNLLLAMMANIELARLQPETKGTVLDEYLAVADDAADRAAKLVKHLMGFSRKTHLEMEVGQLNLVVAEVERLLMRTFDSRIVVVFDLDPDLWHARIDVNQLEQVLLNICLNARDALKGECDEIAISTQNVTVSDSPLAVPSVCIRVADNGVGMTDSIRAKIFDPFFTTKEPGKGTGLGLSMSFGIIEQHGGVLRCSSEHGVGSQFSIYLPRSLDPIESNERGESDLSLLGRSSGRVLIADDESITCDSVANSLRFHGFQVDTVANGLEALEHLRSTVRTDLVLLDLSMPVMSGADALQRIQAEFPSIQVIIYSGYMQELENLQNEEGLPPYAIISKPFKVADIVKLVREAIDERSGSRK